MQTSTVWGSLRFITVTLFPVAYVAAVLGFFEDGIFTTTTGIRTSFWILIIFVAIRLFKELRKRAKDEKNKSSGFVASYEAVMNAFPWGLGIGLAFLVFMGLANIFQHILVIGGSQIVGSIFLQREIYWRMEENK